MKLAREALAHYLNAKFGTEISSAEWELIGDDIEDMSMELNPDVETFKNILGQTRTTDNGYEPAMDADPFYADPDKKIYEPIKGIAFDRKKHDDCKTLLLEVIVEDTEAASHPAYVQEVIVKPQSYGGDTAGVNIPYNISESGKRTKGTVVITDGKPVFTAA